MYEIPHHDDKLEALHIYLEANKTDREDSAWYYLHNPNIVDHVNSMSKVDTERLKEELWTWSKVLIARLADPLSETTNADLDGHYLYASIFLFVDDIEVEEYLVDNISIVSSIPVGSHPIEFYYKVRDKIIRLGKLLGKSYAYSLKQIEEKIAVENANYR